MKKFYLIRTIDAFHIGRCFYIVFAFLVSTCMLSSCTEENDLPIVTAGPTVLTLSTHELVLDQSNGNNTVVNLSWTPASNHGTNAAIDYSLEIDKEGNNFSSPTVVPLERTVYAYGFKGYEINNIARKAFAITPGNSGKLVFRIKATAAIANMEPQYSEPVELTIAPYQPVTPTLYMLGDATPNGWSADGATPMDVDVKDSTIFSVIVQLMPGNYKFITTLGAFLPSYNKGASDNTLFYRTEDDQPDDQFEVVEGGLSLVQVNLSDLTISLKPVAGPPYEQLWVVGGATPKEWDLDNADEMTQLESDPFVFTYSGFLTPGEIKIATAKNWDAPFYRPIEADAPTSSTAVALSAGDPDNKWKVEEEDFYKITLNLKNLTISFEKVDLYLIGDAGPNGWNIETPDPMTKSGSVYTYTGPLNAGELKIAKFKGDWCGGDWINPAMADQSINDTDYITTYGCEGPDNKWKITAATAGNYKITIDLAAGTVDFEMQ